MAGGSTQLNKFDYKMLMLWHLNEISKISATYFEREVGGRLNDPDQEYKRSIITLWAFLYPYIKNDADWKDKIKVDKAALEKMGFFDMAMFMADLLCFMKSQNWLLIDSIDVHDEYREE